MRKKQNEITTKEEIERILTENKIGRLATLGEDAYPYITPVNYVYWQGSIYFHCSLQGEKLDNIRRHPKVCFVVDIPHAYLGTNYTKSKPTCAVTQLYRCVIIRGLAELVEPTSEKVGALNALLASHEKGEDFSHINEQTSAVASCAVVAIRISSLSAKANLAQKRSQTEREQIRAYLRQRGLPGDEETARLIR